MIATQFLSLVPFQAHASGSTNNDDIAFDLQKAQSYILSQYDPSLGLVRENEHIEKYWLWSDNELAAAALRGYTPNISENITKSILNYMEDYGAFRSAYGAILGKDTSFLAPLNKNVTDKVWYTDFSTGNTELQCADYADIAFLKAIHYYKIGDYAQSTECYLAGQRMFDGTGFKDKAYAADDNRYSTYKVALWKIAAELARGGDEDVIVAGKADEILTKLQDAETGGVYTHYRSGFVQDSQTNVETTSLAIFASDTSLLQPKLAPPTPEMLEECKELGIEEEKCSEQAIMTEQSRRVNTPSGAQIELLGNPSMLVMFGLLAAGIGGGAVVFYVKSRNAKEKSRGRNR